MNELDALRSLERDLVERLAAVRILINTIAIPTRLESEKRMQWVKLHVSLLHNVNYRRLSRGAKLTFLTALMEAGECDMGGVLAVRTGPLTVDEIASDTSLPVKQQTEALVELCAAGFFTRQTDGAYAVERWDEKAGAESEALSNAERQRRYRNTHRNATRNRARNGKSNENVTDIETELEIYPQPPDGGYPPTPRNFGDLEPDVATHLALAAAENKSGKLSQGRAIGLRAALGSVLDECSDRDAFAFALREANAKGVPNANYVRQCVRSAMERAGMPPISKRRPAQNDATAMYGRLGTEADA